MLDEGSVHGTQWGVFASRASRSPQSRDRPCITVAALSKYGNYQNAGACGPLAPENGLHFPPIHPLIGGSGGSVFAVSFRQDVVSAKIVFGSGRIIEKPTHLLSFHQATKTHLTRFRFLTLALHNDVCLAQITGYDRVGGEVLSSETKEC